MYYLQSRYYDPAIGRFVNADEYASTGQGIIGHNMFAYCNNCPITQSDATGNFAIPLAVVGITVFALAAAFVGLSFVHHTTVTSSSISTNNTISLPKTNTPAVSSSKKKNPTKKPVNLPSWKKLEVDMDHISSGHMPNGSRNPDDKKSVFVGLTTSQVLKAIREAYNHSSKLTSIGDRIKLSGYSDTFGLVIEIWLNIADDVIETAYPKG